MTVFDVNQGQRLPLTMLMRATKILKPLPLLPLSRLAETVTDTFCHYFFQNRETAARHSATPLPQLRQSTTHVPVKGCENCFRCFHDK